MENFFDKRRSIEQIRFENLSFSYEEKSHVFEDVTVDFPMNDIIWVKAGHSGAGRSTLLQVLAGLLTPNKGKYLINNEDVGDMSFEEFLSLRLSIGYSFDLGGLLHNRTLFENLMLPLIYHNVMKTKEAEDLVTYYMQEMKILKYKDLRPSSVQGGVRKITCLIRPMLLNPELLLLDEPSLGLNQELILKYFDLIQALRKKGYAKHVYISTFDEKVISLIEHRELLLDHGTIHSEFPGQEKKVVHL